MSYDVFLSHATEDKHQVALPLMDRLEQRGLRVWLDQFELRVGESLRQSIGKGLSEASFGVVILSPSYLKKVWTNRELGGLVAREGSGRPLILPVWHNLTREEVLQYSPTLADKIAVSTESGLDYVSEQIVRSIEGVGPRDSKVGRASLAARKEDELTALRRQLLVAGSRFELEHLLYKVDEFLSRYPGDPEARLLRERVKKAYLPPSPPQCRPPLVIPYAPRRTRARLVAAIMAASLVIGSLFFVRACFRPDLPELSPNPSLPRAPKDAR